MRVILLLRNDLLSVVLGCGLQERAKMPMALGRGYKGLQGFGISPVPDLLVFIWAGEKAREAMENCLLKFLASTVLCLLPFIKLTKAGKVLA